MNLTFKMTGEEYYAGWKYKCNKGKIRNNNFFMLITTVLFIIAYSFIFNTGFVAYMFAVGIILISIFRIKAEKKSIISQFSVSPIKCGEHTLRVYDEGIELINSYEKVFAPWKSIFAVKETEQHVMILLSLSKGIAVIDKQKYAQYGLYDIMRKIKMNVQVEGGRNT